MKEQAAWKPSDLTLNSMFRIKSRTYKEENGQPSIYQIILEIGKLCKGMDRQSQEK